MTGLETLLASPPPNMAGIAFAVTTTAIGGRLFGAALVSRPSDPPLRPSPLSAAAPGRAGSRVAAPPTMASGGVGDAPRMSPPPPPPDRAAASVYIATSIDGYIAGGGGSLAFLDPFNAHDRVDPVTGEAGDDLGYAAFLASVDALVMGRNTYDAVAAMDVDWPYGKLRVVVLTSRPLQPPPSAAGTVDVAGGNPAALLARLAAEGVQRVWVDGGATVSRFLAAGLVSSMTLTTVPVVLGGGVRLFGGGGGQGTAAPLPVDGQRWMLIACRSWPDGVVQRTYELREGGEGEVG